MKQDFDKLPIAATEVATEIGNPTGATDAVNPRDSTVCDPSDILCNPEQPVDDPSSNSTGIIIGVVVAIVVVIGIFVVTIFVVRYAHKNQKWCFKPKDKSKNGVDNSHLELESITIHSDTDRTKTASSTRSTKTSKTNTTTHQFASGTNTAVDLVEVNDGEELPENWTKQKHVKSGEIFYVNKEKMISQRHSPNDAAPTEGGGNDMGW